jgi:hypothetical protein
MASVSLHCKVIPWLVALVKFNPTPHPTSAPVFILFSFFNFYEFFFFVAFPFFCLRSRFYHLHLHRAFCRLIIIFVAQNPKKPDQTGLGWLRMCVGGGGNRRELGVQPQLIIISSTGKDREKRKKGKGRRKKKKRSSVEKERCIYYSIPSCWHRTIMFWPSHHQMAAAQSWLPGIPGEELSEKWATGTVWEG